MSKAGTEVPGEATMGQACPRLDVGLEMLARMPTQMLLLESLTRPTQLPQLMPSPPSQKERSLSR